jgi:phospholipase C
MRRLIRMAAASAMLLSLLFVLTVSPAGATPLQQSNGGGQYQHIFYIMMENHAADEIFGNTADAPYINQLAAQYSIALNYYGVTHPSSPNYLAAISGSFQGIWDDCKAGQTVTCAPEEFGPDSGYTEGKELLTPAEIASATATPHWFSGKTIVDQLEDHGLSWKAYMQSMPYAGYTGEYYPILQVNGQPTVVKLYAQKHNPFMYFSDIRDSSERMNKIVPLTQLAEDLNSNNVPNFVWISPDQCHDMHGISAASARLINDPGCATPASGLDHSVIQQGDTFLSTLIPEIMQSKAWTEKSAIIITWDEDDYAGFSGCCHSPTGVNGVTLGGASAPFIAITSHDNDQVIDSSTQYNHYSLLATIEKLWGLGCLANACGFSSSQLMTKFFE